MPNRSALILECVFALKKNWPVTFAVTLDVALIWNLYGIQKVICFAQKGWYREFSPNANFITANFVNAVFQNFPDIFCYCDSIYILLMRFYVLFILLLRSLTKNLPSAIFG